MDILYAVTLRPKIRTGSEILHNIKLVASDQMQALKLACQKAEVLQMEVCRIEEIGVLMQTAPSLFNNADCADDLEN